MHIEGIGDIARRARHWQCQEAPARIAIQNASRCSQNGLGSGGKIWTTKSIRYRCGYSLLRYIIQENVILMGCWLI